MTSGEGSSTNITRGGFRLAQRLEACMVILTMTYSVVVYPELYRNGVWGVIAARAVC